MLNEEVRKIMTVDPITVNSDDNLSTVSEVMKKNKLQQLPVVEGKKLVGMVTSFDLWKVSEQNDKPQQRLPKSQGSLPSRLSKSSCFSCIQWEGDFAGKTNRRGQ